MNKRSLFIAATFIVLTSLILLSILIARGYQFDFTKKTLASTGILVATSDPDGAEVFLDGSLKTATNTTINLPPGDYDIKIVKDGFSPWEKKVTIKKEEVYKTNAFLFPRVPDLRPLTLTGALSPSVSPDMTKVVFGVASASGERNGVWLLDMGRSPIQTSIIGSADFRVIYQDSPLFALSGAKFLWSSDSKQVLVYSGSTPPTIATPSAKFAYLLDIDQLNNSLDLATSQIPTLLTDWQTFKQTALNAQTIKLDQNLRALLASSAANLKFSPDGTKVLYEATGSAHLPSFISTYIPGQDPTAQTRDITPGSIYVYDSKEDRNYRLDSCKAENTTCAWFPSSRHIIIYTNKQISVMEYDGTNSAIVYAGPFVPGIIVPWPNWSKIVILTSLNNAAGIGENLYTINLR